MKFLMKKILAAALVAGGVSAAMALPVGSAIPGGPVLFSDNSAETWLDNNGNGVLDEGDALRGIFKIDNITGSSGVQVAIGAGSSYNELTGIFQTIVTGRTFLFSTPAGNFYNYSFGVDPLFDVGNTGVVGRLYEDAGNNFARIGCGTLANCEATATDGSLWAELGLGAGPNGFWSAANANENPGIGSFLPLNSPLGTFGMGLDFITNNSGFMWNKVACLDTTTGVVGFVDVCGQGGILASGNGLPGGVNSPYGIFDNVDFTANRVPEPGSLALIALGLLGVGAVSRKRKV